MAMAEMYLIASINSLSEDLIDKVDLLVFLLLRIVPVLHNSKALQRGPVTFWVIFCA